MKYHVVRYGPFFSILALEMSKALGCEWSLAPKPGVDVNIWIGYMAYAKWLAKGRKPTKFDAVLFTHHPGGKGHSWARAAGKAHLCLSMCKQHAAKLPKDRTVVWHIGSDERFNAKRPIRFFCCMNTSIRAQIRKKLNWYNALKAGITNSEWKLTGGWTADQVIAGYDWCDYLVVLSTLEGGPRPVQEAMARCKPVIAPDVGFCWEYPVIRYVGLPGVMAVCRQLADAADFSKASIAGHCVHLRTIIERAVQHV